jgi:beta-xylosidase
MTTNLSNKSYPWNPLQEDGSYQNPILQADYSDPDVIRVEGDFYMTASSFNCCPGLPILHSKDLIHWQIIAHALEKVPHQRFDEVQHGQGVWAPALRFHKGVFYIFFPTPDEGIYVTHAPQATGPWSAPHLILPGKGLIDPCPFWDDNGEAWMIHAYAASRAGINGKLHLRPMAPDASALLGPGKIVYDEPVKHPALEGPKLHKIKGWYYFSAPAGGVATGWQLILRSKSLFGPYEERIVLAQRGTRINGPHQGAMVDTHDGEWWFLHFQDQNAYGRVVHLQPMRWEDDWPVIGVEQDENGTGKPVLSFRAPKCAQLSNQLKNIVSQETEVALSPKLGLGWQWHSNPKPLWFSTHDRPGYLRLFPQFLVRSDFSKAGHLLLQKFPARVFAAEVTLSLESISENIHAGLIVMGQDYGAIDFRHTSQGPCCRFLSNLHIPAIDQSWCETEVTLRVEVSEGALCRFGLVKNGQFFQIGPEQNAKKGGWIGAKIGLYCSSSHPLELDGHADFCNFRFMPLS